MRDRGGLGWDDEGMVGLVGKDVFAEGKESGRWRVHIRCEEALEGYWASAYSVLYVWVEADAV